jgi:hypothetical protein
MRPCLRSKFIQRVALMFLVAGAASAVAQWSDWRVMSGSGHISMRSAQSGSTCAFAFRNNSTSMTLLGAKIHYNHSGRVDNDIMVQMGPQQVVGGWTAYSVEDQCSNVYVQVYDEQWR